MGRYLDICNEVTGDRWAKRAAARCWHKCATADLRDRFEERAGICEFDGNLSRDEAERLAFDAIRRDLQERAR